MVVPDWMVFLRKQEYLDFQTFIEGVVTQKKSISEKISHGVEMGWFVSLQNPHVEVLILSISEYDFI